VKAFAYVGATTPQEALAALDPERGRALPLAGGQDLLALMKDYIVSPERVVNVKALPTTIAVPVGPSAEYVVLGAAARLRRRRGPRGPAHGAARPGAGPPRKWAPQIRNARDRGRQPSASARAAGTSATRSSSAARRAVRSASPRTARTSSTPSSATRGRCHIGPPVEPGRAAPGLRGHRAGARAGGEREVAAERFFVMPDRAMYAENALEPNELVTGGPGARCAPA